uniref:Uncharacterized protein n=1 Tax=Cacopsylla melanoneura TaxID=428564 RepID=A0A8D8YIV5_9HEMI
MVKTVLRRKIKLMLKKKTFLRGNLNVNNSNKCMTLIKEERTWKLLDENYKAIDLEEKKTFGRNTLTNSFKTRGLPSTINNIPEEIREEEQTTGIIKIQVEGQHCQKAITR